MSRFYSVSLRVVSRAIFSLILVITIFPINTSRAQFTSTYGVLFETFTNSYTPCPGPNDFYNQFKTTLTTKGSEVIHLNHHVFNVGDPMAQAAVGSSQVLTTLSGGTQYVFVSAVNRTSFAGSSTAPKLSPNQSEWETQIDNQFALPRSTDITVDSAFFDTTTYTFSAFVKTTSDIAFTNTVGIRYAILQDNIHFAQCSGTGPSAHDDVVRYITLTDSALQLTNKPAGTAVHVKYSQRINQISSDTNFHPSRMKLVAFVQESSPSDYSVTTAALLLKNFAALPPPSKSLSIVSSVVDGQSFSPGGTLLINWSKSNIKSVVTSFSSDNGSTWSVIDTVTDKLAFEHIFWTVPSIATTTGKVRVSELGGSTISTETGTFTITAAKDSFAIIRPVPHESDTTGKVLPISWAQRGVTSVTILFSKDNATTFDTLVKNYQRTLYAWTIPDSVATTGAYIQIIPTGASDLSAQEAGPFTIVKAINVGVAPKSQVAATGLRIYPNPITSNATLRANFSLREPASVEVRLYDILGREMRHETLDQTNTGVVTLTVDTRNLPTGSYVLRVSSSTGFVDSKRVEIAR